MLLSSCPFFCVVLNCVVSNQYVRVCLCVPVDGSGSAVDPEYELARRLSEAGIRRMSGELLLLFCT